MRQVVIVFDGAGNILQAGVHEISNVATYESDGFLEYGDGRRRPLERFTQLYDIQPWVDDLLLWWRLGKYYIDSETRDVVAVHGWTAPEG